MKQLLLVFSLSLLLGLVVSAQRRPEEWAKALWLYPNREAWVVTDWLPASWQVCAAIEHGELRGCVSIRELREKAVRERKAKR